MRADDRLPSSANSEALLAVGNHNRRWSAPRYSPHDQRAARRAGRASLDSRKSGPPRLPLAGVSHDGEVETGILCRMNRIARMFRIYHAAGRWRVAREELPPRACGPYRTLRSASARAVVPCGRSYRSGGSSALRPTRPTAREAAIKSGFLFRPQVQQRDQQIGRLHT